MLLKYNILIILPYIDVNIFFNCFHNKFLQLLINSNIKYIASTSEK